VGAQRLHGFGISVGDSGERRAELIQERLESIGSVLVDHGLLLCTGSLAAHQAKPPTSDQGDYFS
jgi:hypothetical protein